MSAHIMSHASRWCNAFQHLFRRTFLVKKPLTDMYASPRRAQQDTEIHGVICLQSQKGQPTRDCYCGSWKEVEQKRRSLGEFVSWRGGPADKPKWQWLVVPLCARKRCIKIISTVPRSAKNTNIPLRLMGKGTHFCHGIACVCLFPRAQARSFYTLPKNF